MNTTPEQIDIQRNFVLKEFCEIVFKKIDDLLLECHTFQGQIGVDEIFYRRVDLNKVVKNIKTELIKLGFVVENFKLSWCPLRLVNINFTIKTKNEIENEAN